MSVYSAGDWTVKPGHEEAFVSAWRASADMDPPIAGLVTRPRLLRDQSRPGHFLSFAEWKDLDSVRAFRARPDFGPVIAAIREHADFTIYTLDTVTGGEPAETVTTATTNARTTTEDIERTAQQYAAAWSSGNAASAAAFFTEDAVRVDAAGGVQHGRAEIQAALDELVHRTLAAPKIVLGRGTIRTLTPELAVWRGSMDIITADGGAPKGNAVLMMRKEKGRWLILEAHAKLFPPPPVK